MTEIHIIVLARLFRHNRVLPISSSGHLVLVPIFTGWDDQGLMMDVAVPCRYIRGGSSLFLERYIPHDSRGLWRIMKGKRDVNAKLVGLIILASLPVIGAGFAVNMYIGEILRSIEVIGWATLGFRPSSLSF